METALALLSLCLASFVQGFLGFGFGIMAMALLASTHDLVHAAGVVNLGGIVTALAMAVGLRKHVDWPRLRSLLPTALAGVLVGVMVLGRFHDQGLTRVLGAVVVLVSIYNLLGRTPRPLHRAWGVPAGALGGVLAGCFNIGGPAIVAYLYSQPGPPDRLKATTQLCFLCMSTLRLPAALVGGMLSADVWRDSALALPALLVGLAAGVAVGRRLPPERFRATAWSAFALLGVQLALRG